MVLYTQYSLFIQLSGVKTLYMPQYGIQSMSCCVSATKNINLVHLGRFYSCTANEHLGHPPAAPTFWAYTSRHEQS